VLADGNNAADNLMPGYERQSGVGKLAVDHVKIGPAHRTGRDLDKHLARARNGRLPLDRG
jgi:hypothetical protein